MDTGELVLATVRVSFKHWLKREQVDSSELEIFKGGGGGGGGGQDTLSRGFLVIEQKLISPILVTLRHLFSLLSVLGLGPPEAAIFLSGLSMLCIYIDTRCLVCVCN